MVFVQFCFKILLFVAVVTATWVVLNRDNLARLAQAHEERQAWRDRLGELRRSTDSLYDERRDLARGGFAAEQAIRERFLYVRPGENLLQVRIPGEEDSLDDAAPVSEGGADSRNPIFDE